MTTTPASGGWVGEIMLACGHGWPGAADDREQAQHVLDLFLATNDTAFCTTCRAMRTITGPLRDSTALETT